MDISQKEFFQLADFIKAKCGIHLKEEKQVFLTCRLQNALTQAGIDNYTDYYSHIVNDQSGSLLNELVNKITTNHTYFMREQEHFFYLRDTVLPYLVKAVTSKDLRIWCAACSTGEEPYTLAMLLDEFFGKEKLFWDAKILATDISSRVLNIAKEGSYDNECVSRLPQLWLMKYFNKRDNDHYTINNAIKNEVIFRQFNLVDNYYPFKKKFHVIFCRNVMMYFDQDTKDRLVSKLYDITEKGGYLFIGYSETLNRRTCPYQFIKPAVYRKI